jgi:hypothetical protein
VIRISILVDLQKMGLDVPRSAEKGPFGTTSAGKCSVFQLHLSIDVFDEDSSSRDDLIGSIELTLSDLQKLANSGSLLVRECQFEKPQLQPTRRVGENLCSQHWVTWHILELT